MSDGKTLTLLFQTVWSDPTVGRQVNGLRLAHYQSGNLRIHGVRLADLRQVRRDEELRAVPERFHAVLQYCFVEELAHDRQLWWFKDVMTGTHYPVAQNAVPLIVGGVEPQGVGLYDGLWRVRRHGGYCSVWPVIATNGGEDDGSADDGR